jgi:hypothetical protein
VKIINLEDHRSKDGDAFYFDVIVEAFEFSFCVTNNGEIETLHFVGTSSANILSLRDYDQVVTCKILIISRNESDQANISGMLYVSEGEYRATVVVLDAYFQKFHDTLRQNTDANWCKCEIGAYEEELTREASNLIYHRIIDFSLDFGRVFPPSG